MDKCGWILARYNLFDWFLQDYGSHFSLLCDSNLYSQLFVDRERLCRRIIIIVKDPPWMGWCSKSEYLSIYSWGIIMGYPGALNLSNYLQCPRSLLLFLRLRHYWYYYREVQEWPAALIQRSYPGCTAGWLSVLIDLSWCHRPMKLKE